MICKAGMTKFCQIWTNENCRYFQRASNVYHIQRGEIFPKSDTHMSGWQIYCVGICALWLWLCALRLKFPCQLIRVEFTSERGWGGCYFGTSECSKPCCALEPATVGSDLVAGVVSSNSSPPPLLSQTQTYLNLEVPLWPSLEFGPFNPRVSFKINIRQKHHNWLHCDMFDRFACVDLFNKLKTCIWHICSTNCIV